MKKVAIITGFKETYHRKSIYQNAGFVLYNIFLQQGMHLVTVSYHHYDSHTKTFSQYVDYTNKGDFVVIEEPYKPDILYVKSKLGLGYIRHIANSFPTISSLETITITSNKYETSLFIGDLQPPTYLLSEVLSSSFNNHHLLGNKVVIKPTIGNGGKGIHFSELNILLEEKHKWYEYRNFFIVQSFKDFSQGYQNIISGNHDIRLVFIGTKFSFCIIRKPQQGSLKSNIAQGGTQYSVGEKDVPLELFTIATEVQKRISVQPHDIYSIDFAYCHNDERRYILELNPFPGIRFPIEDRSYQIQYFKDLAILFLTT
ncbi:MAG: hypothetical protein NZL83_00890 [Candidatus Absconditabacterales bacterium]|nr:hypothetical protein [Candidatus Absconditabacterales bacterium]